ncbi:competence/damage-inducible protein A [Dongia deserti]|uniref:competence/damage-inducible protein A n=1 Tax=Dongia deserti TaxID=2268030 RepID=UPI000E65102A|nr:molybdopterin-binding protein [Dongia deserti]
MSTHIVTAAVLLIGNEILSGRTKDANLNYLATELTSIGVRLMEARVVPDVPEAIIKAVNELRAAYDYLFTTGGIGPTHDDITAECIAKAFGVPLIKDPRAVRLLTNHYGEANLTEARLRMAHMPEGATMVENPVSIAPGFQIRNVFVLAGVPAICRAMFDGLKGRLRTGDKVLSVTISAHVGEGVIAKGLGALQDRYPELEVGSYPFFRQGRFGASFVLRGTDNSALKAGAEELRTLIRSLGAEPIEGEPQE